MLSLKELLNLSSQIRRDVIRMITGAKSGHPGGSLGATDILVALYFSEMKHNPDTWTRSGKDQDVFILSSGHLAPVYYAVLARSGYFPLSELGTLRKIDSPLQGHPSVSEGLKGVFGPSGSLGQGLSVAAGMALGKKMDKSDYRVFCLCGDGESEEGQIWEAAMWAPHYGLDNLVAFTDWNGLQIDGKVESITGMDKLDEKWAVFGWDVIVADGNDFESILDAFVLARKRNGKPKMILFKTQMGHGVDFMVDNHEWHGKAPSLELCEVALKQLEETLGDY